VRLEDDRRQLIGERGDPGDVERPGGDDDLVGLDAPAVELEHERAVRRRQGPHGAAELDRQLERPRVLLQVADHLVAARVAVGVAGKCQSGKRVVAARREQDQRVPALTPRHTDGLTRLDDHEPPARAREEVAHRKAGLAGTNHDHVQPLWRIGSRAVPCVDGGFGCVHVLTFLGRRHGRGRAPRGSRQAP
jgi:hypothetical protein